MEDLGLVLQLTGIGMGMTFLSIGALVLGMYAMTLIVKDRSATPTPVAEIKTPEEQIPESLSASPAKAQAAAAAVAVALAQSKGKQRAAAAAVAVALAQQENTADVAVVSGWDSTIRTRQVTRRDRYASQRRMPNA